MNFSQDQLTPRYQHFVKTFCDRFVENIQDNLSNLAIKDILNWLRLFVYVGNHDHLQLLMDCLSSSFPLRNLRAQEEFQTEDRLYFNQKLVINVLHIFFTFQK